MYILNFKWIPQPNERRVVAKSAIRLRTDLSRYPQHCFFASTFCCFGFNKQIAKKLYRSKIVQKQLNLRNLE